MTESRMIAVELPQWGPPELLTPVEHPVPAPGPGEALIAVEAAALNPVDVKVRAGLYSAAFNQGFPMVLGRDFAGRVLSVGEGYRGFDAGDRVCGSLRFAPALGGYATHLVVRDAVLARLPDSVDAITGAALPIAGLTAWQALVEKAMVNPGQRVLVQAAAGGVGHLTVQLAKLLGAHVVATASTRNQEFLRELGADEVVDYTAGPFEDAVGTVDVVIDCVGGETYSRSLTVLAPGGICVTMADRRDPAEAEALGVRSGLVFLRPDAAQLQGLVSMVADGRLRVHVDRTYPLAQAPAAHVEQETGHVRGKLVLLP
jgi:NADPH:quinone reductase-like Zn-dependent oxidoreductase